MPPRLSASRRSKSSGSVSRNGLQSVMPALAADQRRARRRGRRRRPPIASQRPPLSRISLATRLACIAVDVVDQNRRALARELGRDRATDADTRAGDDRHVVGEGEPRGGSKVARSREDSAAERSRARSRYARSRRRTSTSRIAAATITTPITTSSQWVEMPSRLMPLVMRRMSTAPARMPSDGALAAAQRAAAEHGGGDGVELERGAERGLHRRQIGGVEDAGDRGQRRAQRVGDPLRARGVDAGVARRLLVAADGVERLAEHGVMKEHVHQRRGDQQRRSPASAPPSTAPVASARNASWPGPSPAVPPRVSTCATPRSAIMPPSVTMKGWSPSRVIMRPWIAPSAVIRAAPRRPLNRRRADAPGTIAASRAGSGAGRRGARSGARRARPRRPPRGRCRRRR